MEVRPPVLSVRNDPFRICWLTEAGARYQVQATTDPASAGWTDVGGSIDGTGGTACAGGLAPGAAARWFRVAMLGTR